MLGILVSIACLSGVFVKSEIKYNFGEKLNISSISSIPHETLQSIIDGVKHNKPGDSQLIILSQPKSGVEYPRQSLFYGTFEALRNIPNAK